MKSHSRTLISFLLVFYYSTGYAQAIKYTHADSVKGTYSKSRSWWDVLHYDLHADFNIQDSSIKGHNKITFKVVGEAAVMQLDLMKPMVLDSVMYRNKRCRDIREDGNAYFISLEEEKKINGIDEVVAYFHGKPRSAKMPPWDGGVIWAKDAKNNPWVSIACQGMAAQVWFPNKDHMADEADSCTIHITCPKGLITVANGRFSSVSLKDNSMVYTWKVVNPINNYNIIPYIGKYVYMQDTINGEKGPLDLAFWVLEDNYAKAKKQFTQARSMLHCFEHWFGPYPFYEDGYKLVEAPFLGMEHQSAIAYGNNFQNGYQGRDLSLTGWGLKWDFIIIHESGHEWFGNNITAKDVADNWIHEGFTAYSENLYTEYLYGKQAGAEYVIGTRKSVLNDKPIISDYNVNAGGSIDLYYKAANMLHTIRQIVANDSLWRVMLRGLNSTFWHQTVTTKQVEDYMIATLHTDLQKVFDQYLRTIQIPVLEYKLKKNKLSYRWTNSVKGFNMPVKLLLAGKDLWVKPTEKWQSVSYPETALTVDPNFYINLKSN